MIGRPLIRRGIRFSITCVALCAAPASAQQMLDATDYKAAYCMGRLRDIQLPGYSATDPQVAKDLESATRQKIESARYRLRSYILPRMAYLDSVALTATINAGVRDQLEYEKSAAECFIKANRAGSLLEAMKIDAPCMAEAGWPKLKECEQTKFLPF